MGYARGLPTPRRHTPHAYAVEAVLQKRLDAGASITRPLIAWAPAQTHYVKTALPELPARFDNIFAVRISAAVMRAYSPNDQMALSSCG